MRINLITTCSKGKNYNGCEPASIPHTSLTSIDDAFMAWSRLTNHFYAGTSLLSAYDLYNSAHWSNAKGILNAHENVDLFVISAGLGLLHHTDKTIPYDVTFNTLPFANDKWWKLLNSNHVEQRSYRSIAALMEARPDEMFIVCGSPVYIGAVESDLAQGVSYIAAPADQLKVITSKGYDGIFKNLTIESNKAMLAELKSNMVCLNIKLAGKVVSELNQSAQYE